MPALLSKPAVAYFAKLLAIGVSYVVIVWLSLFLVPPGGGASLVWPPAAFALAVLFVFGIEFWPALLLGFFGVMLARGYTPPLAAAVALGNAAEAIIGAYWLKRFRFDQMFTHLRDPLLLIFATLLSSLVGASLLTMSVYFFLNPAGATLILWTSLWIGHAVSAISFGPFFVRWLYRPFFTKTSTEIIEGTAVFGIIATLNFILWWTPTSSVGGISLIYVLIMALIWASLRTGPRGISLALAMTSLVAATGVLFGYGPVTAIVTSQTLFLLQILIGVLSIIFLLFTSNVEERKEAERLLKEQIGKLEDALERIRNEDQAKAEFLAILAHELRNPLSPILSSLELLKIRVAGTDGTGQLLTSMSNSVHTMARLLDDLLDISRVSQKKFKLQKEPVELQNIVRQSLDSVHPLMQEHRHSVSTSLPKEPLWLLADPVRIEQVFVNLLNNAAKYTDPGGKITLGTERINENIVVRVKDNGMGISPSRLKYIFDPIQKGEPARRPGGLGIGLSLTKRLVELHGGTIEARSAGENKGSEFIVTFPSPNPVQLALPSEALPGRRRARFKDRKPAHISYRILVVDDNVAAAQGMSELLRHGGHETTVAYDSPEALKQVKKFDPHVVVLDIGLPTADGYTVARAIKNDIQSPAVLIALTGYGQEEDKHKATEAGFEYHLVKPVSVADVERILSELSIDH